MSKMMAALAALGVIAVLSFAAPAGAATKPQGVSNAEQVNVSAARRHYRRHYRVYRYPAYRRHYVRRYYYGGPYYGGPYYGYGYYPYVRPYYYRPYYYPPAPFFPFVPWW